VYGLLPLWFLAAVVGRDLVILTVGLWAKNKLGVVLPSNYIGKIAVIVISFTIFFVIIKNGIRGDTSGLMNLIVILEWVSIALMAVSLWAYGWRLWSLLPSRAIAE
jgi:phosphatidylglycerophosphate synthase